MKVLVLAATALLVLSAPPASAKEGGFLTALRVGTTFGVCREKVKAAYGVGPNRLLISDQFKTEPQPDAKGDRLVRYSGFTQEAGQPRVAITGLCHVRRDGPSTIEIGKPQ